MAEDYTLDPDMLESQRLVTRAPVYWEEAGRKRAKVSPVTLEPCATCGVRIIVGMLANGELVRVEPEILTYTMLWNSGERHPRLTVGRGYPAHKCVAPVTPASLFD